MTDPRPITNEFNAAANPPRTTHAEQKIEELNAMRPKPTIERDLTIGGTIERESYTVQQMKINDAIDREVAFWEKQVKPQREAKDRSKESFQRAAEDRGR